MLSKITGVRASETPDETKIFGIKISWVDEERGFGEIDIMQFEHPEEVTWVLIDSELMSKEFVKKVLNALVDDSILESDR